MSQSVTVTVVETSVLVRDFVDQALAAAQPDAVVLVPRAGRTHDGVRDTRARPEPGRRGGGGFVVWALRLTDSPESPA
ncbi:hypothetical protein ACFVXE_36030 [Streptomyces sp. NPDC058231]|uniref:hypothetical protein n=1 Tax=Streptomyces sp. NPDC058231 TaxID=3346392 RepID=UPI0036EFCD73